MLSKAFTTAALALAASSLVSAQTHSDCNPLKQPCPADPAFGNNKVTCDFTKGACDAFHTLGSTSLTYNGNGAVFTINGEGDGPTIRTGNYLFFGRVDVVVQAAPGVGIVTSVVLQSDDLDEIDWEWLGGDNAQVQTNYFSKGDDSTFDRGRFHPVANPTGSFHTYSIEYTSKGVTWSVDGQIVRTLTAQEAGATLPQTPVQVKLGTWVAGREGAPDGTVQWAGGYADFSKAPFLGYYKSISITDYAGSDGPTSKSVKEYIYGDNSGTWQSIKVVLGDGSSSNGGSSGSSTTSGPSSTTASSQVSSSTSSPKTTSSEQTTTSVAHTTLSTVVPTTSSNSTGPLPSGSGTHSAPATVPTSAGFRSVVALSSVLAAGAGAMIAQLFL